MYTSPLARLVAFVLLFSFIFDCFALNNEASDLDVVLQKAFDKIHLSKYGLDYPGTIHVLDSCIKYNDRQCLKVYNNVLAGKKTIQSVSSIKALEATLDIIERACLSKNENLANSTCYGGILSLYFYTSNEQDKKILDRIKTYPKAIRNIIFGDDFFWYHNRPNKDVWINAISTMDIDWRNDIHKQRVLSLFGKRIEDIEDVKNETWVVK